MDFRHRVLACATTWRRPTPPAPSPIVDYYVSPGGAGDYAEASTALAAATIFPGAGVPAEFTLAFWVKRAVTDTFDEFLFEAKTGTPNEALFVYLSDPNNDNYFQGFFAGGDSGSASIYAAYPDISGWAHVVFTVSVSGDGATLSCRINGVEIGADTQTIALDAVGSSFALLSTATGAAPLDASIRNIHIFDRALTSGEIAALYAAGPTHNIRAATGAWTGGTAVVSWDTPAVAGVVVNSGTGGACNLVLNGAVTSEVDA